MTFSAQTLEVGERVKVDGYTYGEGAFDGYGRPEHSCSPDHLSSPSERIAYVVFDRYGRNAVWEGRIQRQDESRAYVTVRDA